MARGLNSSSKVTCPVQRFFMRAITILILSIVALAIIAPSLLASIIGGALAITVSGLIGLFIVGMVMLVVGVVFGSTLLALLAGGVTLLLVGFSVLWPLLFICFLVWLCCRDNKRETV